MDAKNILVVEDERIIAEDIRESLERLDYAVPAPVSSGEEAIRQAGELSPDLVLMDLHLKGEMSGSQAAAQIQERHRVPVIFLTAYSDQESLDQVKNIGAYGYLLNPFNERELYTSIEVALHKHAMEEELREVREQLERRVQELEGHDRLTHFQLSMHSCQEAHAEILQVLEAVLAVEAALIYQPGQGEQPLETVAALGLSAPGRLETGKELPAPALPQASRDLVLQAFTDRQPRGGDREAAVPLLDRQQAIGAIWIRRDGLDDESRHALWRLAATATLVLRGAQTCDGLNQAALSLEELQNLE